MRYGIFSDVHSNLEAFSIVYDFYKSNQIDKYIFIGDIVGYGANPKECLYLLKNLNPVSIAGNHDWAAVGKLELDYFNEYAKIALLWTKEKISFDDCLYIKSFLLFYEEDNFVCVHGSLEEPQKFNYILGIMDSWRNFSLLKKDILFVGHSHRRESYVYCNGKVMYMPDMELEIQKNTKYIINVGSVGQPRDRDNRSCVCIYDSDRRRVFFKRLEYNIKKAAEKILEEGLPQILATRLYIGG
ncbi:MAG: metallophosphatase family protein [Candidatus Omnitrophica bacterium]|nr:metallophosphatase family protein [Candidatus Omnitrophota bacterium]